jgi:hypothetical protein
MLVRRRTLGTKILKGILTKNQNKCFSYMWLGNRSKEGIPLVKWSRISKPNKLGGWDLKNIYLLGLFLATKFVWSFI